MSNPTMIELSFLRRLERGESFEAAALACGEQGLKVAFNCLLNGWINHGHLTASGLALLAPVIKTNRFEITVMPSKKPEDT